jgi:hypothetical protein
LNHFQENSRGAPAGGFLSVNQTFSLSSEPEGQEGSTGMEIRMHTMVKQ